MVVIVSSQFFDAIKCSALFVCICNSSTKSVMGKRRDIRLFKNVVQFYSFIGIFPYIFKYKKLFLLYYGIGITTFVTVCVKYTPLVQLSKASLVLGFSSLVTLIIFSLLCLKKTFVQENIWNDLFNYIETFDSTMGNQKVTLEENVYKYYSKFVIGTALYGVIYLSMYLATSVSFNYLQTISISYYLLLNIQLLITSLSVDKLFNILEKRYEYLKRQTRKTFLFLNTHKESWNVGHQQLKASYLLLVNIVNTTNELFGQKIMLIVIIIFMDITGSLYLAFLIRRDSTRLTDSISIFHKMTISVVSIIYISQI